ncbi:MAG: hypothetical protein KDA88_08065 [Planctomycetaceae bacterium]|nr:hypothetical protein [Planctomycetaceae bacterium]MCB9953643.1 hypothetical protein [Planctomycetaceae bacterium]
MTSRQASSATPKVVCLGFHKTGTTTFGRCMKILGLRHRSVHPNSFLHFLHGRIDVLLETMRHYDSFDGWPLTLVYRDLYSRFSESLFVPTTRSTDAIWLESLTRHVDRLIPGVTSYRPNVYRRSDPVRNPDNYLQRNSQHNREVRAFFADKSSQFIDVCWEREDGWPELCCPLSRPVPSIAFPHLNASPVS